MIGETIRAHIYHDRLVFYIGQTLTSTLPRVYLKAGQERGRCIDYRHIIHSLSAKPQAFRFLRFREELLPTETYRNLWRHCEQQFDTRDACKWVVGVLRIVTDNDCEESLGCKLIARVGNNRPLPSLKALQERYLGKQQFLPSLSGNTSWRTMTACCRVVGTNRRWAVPETIEMLLKALKLPTFVRHYRRHQEQAVAEGYGHIRYLSGLCEQEAADRYQKRVQKWTSEAKLPAGKSFANLSLTELSAPVQQ